MPELPEVETVTNGLSVVLKGGRVFSIKFYRQDLREKIPVVLVKKILVGQIIDSVVRRSKYILLGTEKGYVISHLGMTGSYLTRTTPIPQFAHTHFVIGVKSLEHSKIFIHYVDPRRFGRLSATYEDPYAHPFLSSLGVEPLEHSSHQLGKYLYARSRKRLMSVKNFIMDAKIVVGVGNIYACESLFKAGISPLRQAGKISKSKYSKLAEQIICTLREAIKLGGSTIKDFKNSSGETGYFSQSLQVYDREGDPCCQCNEPIFKVKQTGRSTWYCRICQK